MILPLCLTSHKVFDQGVYTILRAKIHSQINHIILSKALPLPSYLAQRQQQEQSLTYSNLQA